MRSCLSAFLFTLLLIGAVVGVGALAMGQVRMGVCAQQPLRVILSLAGGALLLVAILVALFSLVNLELFEKGLSGAHVAVFAISMTIIGLGLASFFTVRSAQSRCPRLDLASELQGVCLGQGLARVGSALSAAEVDGAGFKVLSATLPETSQPTASADHLVVLDNDGQAIPWSQQASDEWKPESISEVGLVVCVGEAVQERLETCLYGGGIRINRYQETIPVRLVDGQTGQTLAAELLTAVPPACQPLGLQDLARLRARVTFDEMKTWVAKALAGETAVTVQQASPTPIQASPTPWPTATIHPSPSPTPEFVGKVKTGSRVRAGPSTEDKVITGLVKGEEVLILGSNQERTWLKILTPKGETGWIFAELVKPPVPIDQLPLAP